MTPSVTLDDARAAASRIASHVDRTPVLRCDALAPHAAGVWLKCEHHQRTGSFKARGACNAVWSLSDADAARGVATHSSGNHGAALAYAAQTRGIACTVCVPTNAPASKRANIAANNALIVDCGPTQAEREAALAGVVQETGAVFVPPFDHPAVIAGQATATLELLTQAEIDVVLAPIGGGGLLAGACVAASTGGARVIGAEPANADDTARTLMAGERVCVEPDTIADGLRMQIGDLPLSILRATPSLRVLTVTEPAIEPAMRRVYEHTGEVIEPSAAVPVAAMAEHADAFAGQRVGVLLTGGNVDRDGFTWLR